MTSNDIITLYMQWFKNTFKHLPLAIIANLINGFPAKKLVTTGVVGTDGKTTTSTLIYHLLSSKEKTGLVSTIEAKIENKIYPTGSHVTSPNPFVLFKFLKLMVRKGIKQAVLETTSHGLDQHRFWGIKFDFGVLTNITHEHLDYHKTYANYLSAKYALLKKSKIAIINKDDQSYKEIEKKLRSDHIKHLTYAIKQKADYVAKNIKYGHNSTTFTVVNSDSQFQVTTNLIGEYNVYNCLAAIAAVKSNLGQSNKEIADSLLNFSPPKGRMEKVKNNKGLTLIIDFAHTPNALKQVLKTIKNNYPNKKIIALFGSAAKRDIEKRPMMGKIAADYADNIVLTSEDPRKENPEKIIEQIAKGSIKGGMEKLNTNEYRKAKNNKNKYFFSIPNRQEAISFAVRKLADKGDLIIFLGKGHEDSICYGDKEYPWSEKQAIETALEEKA